MDSGYVQDFKNLLNFFRQRSQIFLTWILWNLTVFVLFYLLSFPQMRLIIFTIVVGTIFLSVSYFVLAAFFFYASGNEIIIDNVMIIYKMLVKN